MITTTSKTVSLPKIIAEQWKIADCLSIKSDSEVYLLEGTSHKEIAILKTFPKNTFSKKKYKKISLLSNKYLILPKKHYDLSGTHYVLYSSFKTLEEILSQSGISLWELLSLGMDLTCAVTALSGHHIYEADISPNNIYQNTEGSFCLGDLNLQTACKKGTPGFIAPEISGTKPRSKENFDRAMQYSICKLLDSIYRINESAKTDGISHLIKRGMEEQPNQRFSSLAALGEELQKQQKQLEKDLRYQLFQIKETDHTLFRVKTISAAPKEKIPLYPILWIILVLAGCFCLVILYRHLHPDKPSTANGIYLSQVSETDPVSPASTTPISSAAPIYSAASTKPASPSAEPETASPSTELDFQKKGLTSLSSLLSQTEHPEEAVYLYAGENRLTDTLSIHRFSKIREVYLDNNRIRRLSEISTLKNLEILVLSYNQLKTLPDLSKLIFLKHLDISSNPDFKDVDSLKNLTSLTTLNIAGTGISKKQYHALCRELTRCKIVF